MTNEKFEDIAQNVARFVILLLFAAGFLFGMGIHFLVNYLGSQFLVEEILLGAVAIGAAVGILMAVVKPTLAAKFGGFTVFSIGILIGGGASVLLAGVGSQVLVVLLLAVIVMWGLIVFGEKR